MPLVQQNFMFGYVIESEEGVCSENGMKLYILKMKCEQLVEKKGNQPIMNREKGKEREISLSI